MSLVALQGAGTREHTTIVVCICSYVVRAIGDRSEILHQVVNGLDFVAFWAELPGWHRNIYNEVLGSVRLCWQSTDWRDTSLRGHFFSTLRVLSDGSVTLSREPSS